MIQVQMLASTKEGFCIERNTLRPWFAQSELDGHPLFSVTRLLPGLGRDSGLVGRSHTDLNDGGSDECVLSRVP